MQQNFLLLPFLNLRKLNLRKAVQETWPKGYKPDLNPTVEQKINDLRSPRSICIIRIWILPNDQQFGRDATETPFCLNVLGVLLSELASCSEVVGSLGNQSIDSANSLVSQGPRFRFWQKTIDLRFLRRATNIYFLSSHSMDALSFISTSKFLSHVQELKLETRNNGSKETGRYLHVLEHFSWHSTPLTIHGTIPYRTVRCTVRQTV